MDVSEKDAARSKWRQTQRHRKARGRAGAARGALVGRGHHGAGGVDLGTNADRFYDGQAEAEAEADAPFPVQQSQGADLAELLLRSEPFDRAYHYRARVNLAAELEPPPDLGPEGLQALTLDLEGLATCLSHLPLNELLDTDVFSDGDGAASWQGASSEAEDDLDDLADSSSDGQEQQQAACAAAVAEAPACESQSVPCLAAMAGGMGLAPAAEQPAGPQTDAHAPVLSPAAAAAATLQPGLRLGGSGTLSNLPQATHLASASPPLGRGAVRDTAVRAVHRESAAAGGGPAAGTQQAVAGQLRVQQTQQAPAELPAVSTLVSGAQVPDATALMPQASAMDALLNEFDSAGLLADRSQLGDSFTASSATTHGAAPLQQPATHARGALPLLEGRQTQQAAAGAPAAGLGTQQQGQMLGAGGLQADEDEVLDMLLSRGPGASSSSSSSGGHPTAHGWRTAGATLPVPAGQHASGPPVQQSLEDWLEGL